MSRSFRFYTQILDFQISPNQDLDSPVIDLLREGAKLQLSTFDGVASIAINAEVSEVDELFKSFVARGLDISAKPDSPVHQGPIDQTWGTREFYVTDPDGNTLRFRACSRE